MQTYFSFSAIWPTDWFQWFGMLSFYCWMLLVHSSYELYNINNDEVFAYVASSKTKSLGL